jgi:hypothetical protein
MKVRLPPSQLADPCCKMVCDLLSSLSPALIRTPLTPFPLPPGKAGLGGYYRGLRTKIVQSVLAAALLFVAKEKITDFTRDLLEAAQSSSSGSNGSTVAAMGRRLKAAA